MAINELLDQLRYIFSLLRWVDLIDVMLVWLVVYRILLLTKRTGAVQILSGLGILSIAYLFSIWAELISFNWLLEKFFANLFLILVILFQGEIRRALAQIGSDPFYAGSSPVEETHLVEELAKGALQLAQKGIGGLIVLEHEIALDYFIEIGSIVDSVVSAEVLISIFQPGSPIHDGAVIVRGGRIYAAGSFLPLSKNPALDRNLGTRHRAAIGLTEETDALVLVVSEESRAVGIVQGGQITLDVDHATIRKVLYDFFGLKFKGDRSA